MLLSSLFFNMNNIYLSAFHVEPSDIPSFIFFSISLLLRPQCQFCMPYLGINYFFFYLKNLKKTTVVHIVGFP